MKKEIVLRAVAILLAAVLLPWIPVVYAAPGVSAQSAVLMDASNRRVLWSKKENERALVASTTKIMTGLLIAENCDLSASVQVPIEAVGIEGSSIYLQEGEILTVEALLYGMMLHSGNDAAIALALYHSGDLNAFVSAMNEKAAELGLTNTCFANPHGLDDENNYSTAYDLALLTAYAMENPVFYRVVSCKTASFSDRSFTNHNKLLWRYDGAVGVKTGYTKTAGRILVSCAERDGRRLIAVTVNAPDDWDDHAAILDYGFSKYVNSFALRPGQIMGQVHVISGAEEYSQVVTSGEYICLVAENEAVTFEQDLPEFVFAPVLAGEKAGCIRILINGVIVEEIPLFWRYSVLERG